MRMRWPRAARWARRSSNPFIVTAFPQWIKIPFHCILPTFLHHQPPSHAGVRRSAGGEGGWLFVVSAQNKAQPYAMLEKGKPRRCHTA